MKVGVIGLGVRMLDVVTTIKKYQENLQIVAVADLDIAGVRKKISDYPELFAEKPLLFEDADEMLDRADGLCGVFIGTRCSSHTEMAIKVIRRKIPLFLEKPVCTTFDDVNRLNAARLQFQPKVIVSFPLRPILLYDKVKQLADSGIVGRITAVEAFNNVSCGRVYYKNWYRDEAETGGLWLQKATHDLDFINYLLGERPIKLCAMYSKQVFTGNMPANLKCVDCDQYKTCPESTYVIRQINGDDPHGEFCSFAVDTGNEDSGSVIVRYASGMHATYTQNFYSRRKAARRGARLYGAKGAIAFDLGPNEIKVYFNDRPEIQTYAFSNNEAGHHGGDDLICRDFLDMMHGRAVQSTLKDGILSAYMCLLARESCRTDQFMDIKDLDAAEGDGVIC